MLKTIAAASPELTQFVEALKLPLNKPQHQHVTQIADGLITTQGSNTLSALYRHIVCCTDLSLSADEALNGFLKRWSCEAANWYIAERLGWADCRLWRVEAAEKFLVVLWLALAYLEHRQVTEAAHTNLADVIRLHRQDHAVRVYSGKPARRSCRWEMPHRYRPNRSRGTQRSHDFALLIGEPLCAAKLAAA